MSRDAFLDIGYSTAVAVPVYSKIAGSASEFRLGPAEGMKIDCVARCDELTSVLRTELTDYVGSVPAVRFPELSRALAAALAIEQIDLQR